MRNIDALFEIPDLISTGVPGLQILASTASSNEIERAIQHEEKEARRLDAENERGEARVHWKRWSGLHLAYLRALVRETRDSLQLDEKLREHGLSNA